MEYNQKSTGVTWNVGPYKLIRVPGPNGYMNAIQWIMNVFINHYCIRWFSSLQKCINGRKITIWSSSWLTWEPFFRKTKVPDIYDCQRFCSWNSLRELAISIVYRTSHHTYDSATSLLLRFVSQPVGSQSVSLSEWLVSQP